MGILFWRRERPILFMHLPKCGGTSVARALGGKRILSGLDATLLGDFRDYASMAERTRERLYLGELPAGRYDLVHGHFAMSSLVNAFPRGRLMTVLREPRARALSNFRYAQSLPLEKLEKLGSYGDRLARNRRPEDFFQAPELASITDNVFARFLLAPDHALVPPGAFIDKRFHGIVFNDAWLRLKRFAFVGAIEDRDLAGRLSKFLGRKIVLDRHNVTPAAEEISVRPALLDRVTAIDERLWLAAQSLAP